MVSGPTVVRELAWRVGVRRGTSEFENLVQGGPQAAGCY